ncbi:MAG TPA: hypothetical protein VFJ07_14880, partial [Streptosporangiaceae bacterium]|nr:hypothetical protein [Streptosporangiaceae bacterium]
ASIPPEDQFTRWRSEYETDILVSLASLAGERMFFDSDSSSGVSGDLESATTVASFMEGFWGMGSTVSSYSTAKRLEVGSPGGGQGGRNKKGQDPEQELRRALADRIEDTLGNLLRRVETLLREDRVKVLSLAHALETHKTMSGEDIVAVMEHTVGPLVDGRPYADPEFLGRLEEYHQSAAVAHRSHGMVAVPMPPAPALAPVVQGAVASLDGPAALEGGPGTLDGGSAPDGGTGLGQTGGLGQNGGPGHEGGTGPNGSQGVGGEWAPGSDWAPGSGPPAASP